MNYLRRLHNMPRKFTKRTINSNLDAIAAPITKENLRPSAGREQMIGEFYFLDVMSLSPYPHQARSSFNQEDLESLSKTIEKHGIRQPLTVAKVPDEIGKYYVISGERRLRAAKLVNLKKVPCIILDDADNTDEIALIENLQRKDLHPLEIAKALLDILDNDDSMTKTDLAKGIGLGKAYISECLQYITLPPAIQDVLLKRNIFQRVVLRRLLKCNNEHAMRTMLGEDKKNSKRPRKRNIFNIYIENGKCSFKKGSARLTPEEKVELVNSLEDMLRDLRIE